MLLDYINVSTLARCYLTGEDWVSVTGIFLYYFLQLHVNLQLSQNKKFKEKGKHRFELVMAERCTNVVGTLCV